MTAQVQAPANTTEPTELLDQHPRLSLRAVLLAAASGALITSLLCTPTAMYLLRGSTTANVLAAVLLLSTWVAVTAWLIAVRGYSRAGQPLPGVLIAAMYVVAAAVGFLGTVGVNAALDLGRPSSMDDYAVTGYVAYSVVIVLVLLVALIAVTAAKPRPSRPQIGPRTKASVVIACIGIAVLIPAGATMIRAGGHLDRVIGYESTLSDGNTAVSAALGANLQPGVQWEKNEAESNAQPLVDALDKAVAPQTTAGLYGASITNPITQPELADVLTVAKNNGFSDIAGRPAASTVNACAANLTSTVNNELVMCRMSNPATGQSITASRWPMVGPGRSNTRIDIQGYDTTVAPV